MTTEALNFLCQSCVILVPHQGVKRGTRGKLMRSSRRGQWFIKTVVLVEGIPDNFSIDKSHRAQHHCSRLKTGSGAIEAHHYTQRALA